MTAITRFFVDRWQLTIVLFALLVALGVSALRDIPKSEDPVTRFPAVGVVVVLPGADAEQMERLVAIPVENALNGLDDVRQITSASKAGVATIGVEFVYGSDPEKKYDEVVRELNVVRPELPEGITLVRADRRNPAQANVVQMALVSATAPYRQMEAYARDLRDALERATGVQHADIWGVPTSEVRVAANLDRLAAYRLPLTALADALAREGVDAPIGAVESGGRRFNVEATGAFDSLDEIRGVALRSADGSVVTVGDVADVTWANDEPRHITRFNGERALFVTARAKLGVTVFDVIAGIRSQVDAFAPRLPPDIRLERGFDQAETVEARLGSLARDFMLAIALVLLTLLPLGYRASLVVMTSIPLSLAMGVAALHFLDYSLNQLSIAGFVLALGLLVDDSIVVTENIARRLREGLTARDAAIAGVSEINVAVIGCTATLLLAFVPLMSLPEGAGDFIRSLPVAVVCTIASSLIVSLTIVPFLASRMLGKSAHSNVVLDSVMGAIHRLYGPMLRIALGWPRATVVVGLAAFAASLLLIPRLGFSLFPENDSPYFLIDVELPEGSAVSETDRAVLYADRLLAEDPQFVWRFANSGRGNPQIYYNVIPEEQQSNVGAIYARFASWDPDSGHARLEALRAKLNDYPGARFNVRRFENGPPIEAPIAVRVRGPDILALTQIAADVEGIVRETPGTRDVTNPLAARLVDLDMNVDDAAAALRGIPAGAVDRTLKIAIGGEPVAAYRDPVGDAYPVMLRAAQGRHDGWGPRPPVCVERARSGDPDRRNRRSAAPVRARAYRSLRPGARGDRACVRTVRAPDLRSDQGRRRTSRRATPPARLLDRFRWRGRSAAAEFRRSPSGGQHRAVRHHGGAAARIPVILDRCGRRVRCAIRHHGWPGGSGDCRRVPRLHCHHRLRCADRHRDQELDPARRVCKPGAGARRWAARRHRASRRGPLPPRAADLGDRDRRSRTTRLRALAALFAARDGADRRARQLHADRAGRDTRNVSPACARANRVADGPRAPHRCRVPIQLGCRSPGADARHAPPGQSGAPQVSRAA
jgi:multidrug efflux pump subunit AcrB